MNTPACTGDCTSHGQLCERDPGHDGDHECRDCPGEQARQRARMIAERVAAAGTYHDLIETTPDED